MQLRKKVTLSDLVRGSNLTVVTYNWGVGRKTVPSKGTITVQLGIGVSFHHKYLS
jgi:hypothetical protein